MKDQREIIIPDLDYQAEVRKCKTMEDVVGKNGLMQKLFKDIIQQLLEAEMEEHLGRERHERSNEANPNYRNGYSSKTIESSFGEVGLDIPRDRKAQFEPKVVKKYETVCNELDKKIIGLYACGMSVRDIQSEMEELYGIDVSPAMISKITDKVVEAAAEWQSRELDEIYPIVYMDAMHFKVRDDNKIVSKAAYICMALDMKGEKDILEDGSTGKDSVNLSGDFLGVMGKMSLLNYKFEYRNIDSGLTPGYFGRLYEVKYNQNLDKALNSNKENISGYFGELGANFGGIINLNGSYEDYDKDEINPHLTGQLNLVLSKKLQAKIGYDQTDLGSELHKDKYFNEDTVIFANITAPATLIGIPGPVTANINIKQNYNYNEIKFKYEPTRIYSLGLALTF